MRRERREATYAEIVLANKVRQQRKEIENLYMQLIESKIESDEIPVAEKVIFHDRSTIIYWEDGSKTVVTCSKNDEYSKDKGFYLCFLKKIAGNTTTGLMKLIEPLRSGKNVWRK